ncbi:MAG TPA: LLM class F420-dependent oxidoreductase [Anaerolineales bacterium]
MQIGVVYPQIEFGVDPAAIRDYAQTAEGLGYSHVIAYDHILGANPNRPGGWKGPYTFESTFFEPFVLFSYMASFTQKLGFAPGIIILPQRQTALVAKQAACLDVLSGGRLRLGVGLGWNEVEYTALNEDFHTRGRRMEEQVGLLRQLWTQPLVSFSGRWHTIPDAGLNPLPVQRPIPIWFGANVESALERVARLADGWMSNVRSAADARPALEILDRALQKAGRSRADFGIEARIPYGDGNSETWQKLIQGWQAEGVNLFSVNTMNAHLATPAEHIQAIRRFAQAVGI